MNNQYYVYALLDPRKFNAPFYVGKGTGDRCFQHLNGRCKGENKFKDKVINAIRKVGGEPKIKILSENMKEDNAYDLETWYTQLWGRRNIDPGGILTNISLGKKPPKRKGTKLTNEQRKKLKGRIPWNKGLTKETDNRVKRNGQLISQSLKGNVPWNKGLDKTNLTVANNIESLIPFEKGRVPWNKNTKGIMKSNSGTWKKGRIPWSKIFLNQHIVKKILNDNRTQREIVESFGIPLSVVRAIKQGRRKADTI